MKWLALGIALISIVPDFAEAEVITRCGASKGTSWYFFGPMVSREKSGWNEDGISQGEILLILDRGDADIVYTDAFGTRSSRGDGGTVVLLSENSAPGFVLALAVYPQTATAEHYVFQLDQAGNGLVMWGTARAGGAIQKSTLLQARCRKP